MRALSAIMRRVKQSVERHLDCRVYRNSLPKGADLFADLRRYGYTQFIHTVCDVGANVGDFARAALRAIPHCRVFAFEPATATVQRLNQHLSRHPRLTVLPHALGATEGRARLQVWPESKYNCLTTQAPAGTAPVQFEWVEVRRLDRIAEQLTLERIDLLKTDTEGFDVEVLRGAAGLLEEERVALVLTEVGFQDDNQRPTPFSEVDGLLREHGFDLVGFYHQSHFRRLCTLDYCDALYIHPAAAERLLQSRAA